MSCSSETLPSISRCHAPAPRRSVLQDTRVFQMMAVAAMAAALGCAHVWLQFSIGDMHMQNRQYQEKYRILTQMEAVLAHQNEALCNAARLKSEARSNSDLVAGVSVQDRPLVAMPAQVRSRYFSKPALSVGAEPAAEASLAGGHADVSASLPSALLALVDAGASTAQAAPQQP